MFTWGSKYLFGIGAAGLLGAIVYGLVTGGDPVGVVSIGYKGGVGDHTGYGTLLGVGVAGMALGVLNFIIRDGDAEASGGDGGALSIATPRTASYWGPVAAFGLACLALGVAVSSAFFILGLVILSMVLIEWVILAWSDRATGDPVVNATIRDRILGPFEVPVFAALSIAVFILGVSRVLLTVSKTGSVVVASVAAFLVFVTAIALAKSKVSRQVMSGVVAVGAIAVLAGGIFGAVNGEREIAHHGDDKTGAEHGDDHGGEGEGE